MDAYSKDQLRKRESEFCEYRDTSVFFGSWNVNGKMPGESLQPWLFPHAEIHDIYAIG
jgi:hypothetical protein